MPKDKFIEIEIPKGYVMADNPILVFGSQNNETLYAQIKFIKLPIEILINEEV
jgi:hypothetical protein